MMHERILIGCCAIDPACVDQAVQSGVSAVCFTVPERSKIWQSFVALRMQGKSTDLLTTSLIMGTDCPFKEFSECEATAPTSINFRDALDATLWAAKARRIKTASDGLGEALKLSKDPTDILGLISQLQEIAVATNDGSAADMDAATDEVGEEFQNVLDGKKDTRVKYPMPLPLFDKTFGDVHANELVMVAARPSVGKTSFVVQWTTELVRAGFNVAFIPTEVEARDIIRQIASQVAQVDLLNLRTEFPDKVKKAKATVERIKSSKKLKIFDKSTDLTAIWAACRMVKDWADVVILDHMAQVRNPAKSRYESVTDTSSAMVAIKKMLGKPLIVANQLKRLEVNSVPGLQDLKDSGAAEQDASRVLLIHYPDDDFHGMKQTGLDVDHRDTRDYYIIQAKNRFGQRDVTVKCKYKASTTTFQPV